GDLRGLSAAARAERGGDRALLGGLHPPRREPARRRGAGARRVVHGRARAPLGPRRERSHRASGAARRVARRRGRAAAPRRRLGDAELLWSRVSREPEATVAVRPGASVPALVRDDVVLAGAWTAPPWPPTMESAVRSGRAAARAIARQTAKAAA